LRRYPPLFGAAREPGSFYVADGDELSPSASCVSFGVSGHGATAQPGFGKQAADGATADQCGTIGSAPAARFLAHFGRID